ncbi:MAG: hypothetical protein ACI83D_000333 [Planctomycetota bacterium]|jgi:hypothetical protein
MKTKIISLTVLLAIVVVLSQASEPVSADKIQESIIRVDSIQEKKALEKDRNINITEFQGKEDGDYFFKIETPKGYQSNTLTAAVVEELETTSKLADINLQIATMQDVVIILENDVDAREIEKIAHRYNISLEDGVAVNGPIITGSMTAGDMEKLATNDFVDIIGLKPEELPLLSEVRALHHTYEVPEEPGDDTDQATANRIVIGIGDGGELHRHFDNEGHVINLANGTYSSYGNHADAMAGIIAGRGIIEQPNQGHTDATLITQKTSQITYHAAAYKATYGMSLTNNSYGTSHNCNANGSYNYTSSFLDKQIREIDVLHVYAAGNSGGATCPGYPTGYKTVLRYYQSAKNVLTVGATNDDRTTWIKSSRGPVADGRIKPEIVTIGTSVTTTKDSNEYWTIKGTSAAAPTAVGIAAKMQERYKNIHGQQAQLSSAMTKAVLMNTADDGGNKGPDYEYGYGIANLSKALDAIERLDDFSSEGTIDDDEVHSIGLTIPEGVTEAKIMLYWHDVEAAAYADPTLVNDLDLLIHGPDGFHQPYILDATPAMVDQPATLGEDHVNNSEQVVLTNPLPGRYKVSVMGYEVPMGPQDFVITWTFEDDTAEIQHPVANQKLLPGSDVYITWDADVNNTQPLKVSYTSNIDSGNWQLIDTVEANNLQLLWTVPEGRYGDNFGIRIHDGGAIDSQTGPFTVLGRPTVTANQVLMTWTPVEGAVSYDIYGYNDGQLQKVGTTTDLSYPTPNTGSQWVAVRAVLESGTSGIRSATVRVE